jgi:hypothetical protein
VTQSPNGTAELTPILFEGIVGRFRTHKLKARFYVFNDDIYENQKDEFKIARQNRGLGQ